MAASTKTMKAGPGFNGPCVFSSTSAPTADNDGTNGCHVGDFWIKSDTHKLYVCEDASTAAAVWTILN